MKKLLTTIAIVPVLLALLLAGCTVSDPDHPDGLTSLNGHKYMSLGNSLTAGYMDSGLIMNGQMASYPRLIAGQMGLDTTVGTGEFSQPWIASPGIGSSEPTPGSAAGVLYFDGSGISVLGETPLVDIQSILLAATDPTPYNNLGVPGALLWDVMNAYSAATSFGPAHGGGAETANPFFDFINRASFFGNLTGNPATEDPTEQPSMFRAAIAKGAGLATLWIGNNDVLGGATSGNPVIGAPGAGNITPAADFGVQYNILLQSLAGGLIQRNGLPSTIVVANIPYISDIPYFFPVAVFEGFMNGAWTEGYAESNVELVTLKALSYAPAHMDDPLPSEYTLTTSEIATVTSIVDAYNTIITDAVATINGLYPGTCGIYDANDAMANLPTANKTHFLFVLPQVGGDVTTAAATTYFSLDGVQPNQKGYGMIAKGFLDAINTV
ncbi:MAG: hypothetical protein GY780_14400, partial [bacterium]|nr:hypothetical protein [bacterium]